MDCDSVVPSRCCPWILNARYPKRALGCSVRGFAVTHWSPSRGAGVNSVRLAPSVGALRAIAG
jgi:hypothetical protein